ncbi:uncharacterized protein LOC112876482 [Panicum hallii]|nr:uncharacterized protein LOC112876482 [Panicum hallii]
MTSPPSSPPSWVILGSVARVCAADADLPPGADLSLALAPPPRVSHLTIPPRFFPDAPTARDFPVVLAADPSGLLLLHANQGRATGPLVIDRPGLRQFGLHEFVGGYFVLDAASASAFAIPEPELISERAFLGLLLHPGGGRRYAVAELQPIVGRDHAYLFCFSSDVGEWVQKVIPRTLPHRLWVPAAVLAHHGRLWWADLSFGFITCDPFADAPVLAFVPLPPGKALRHREAAGVLDRYRVVGLSAGKLRFVDMYRNRDRRGALQVSVWTLPDPEATEWALEHEASFPDIWADRSYKAAGLPMKIPVLALIHPKDPAIVYFFLEEHLFGVDLHARSVVECEVYEMVAPDRDLVATRFVHAWELPRALSSCSEPKDQDEEKLSPTSPPPDMKTKE